MFKAKLMISVVAGAVIAGSTVYASGAISSSGKSAAQLFETTVAAQPAPLARPAADLRTREASPTQRMVVASSDGTCSKVRRKLFVEGEGWIVRRVAACQ